MTARLFGLLAILIGLSYASEGVNWLLHLASGTTDTSPFWFEYQVAVVVLDFFDGLAAMLSGVGLILLREWGRKCWLALLPLALLLHAVFMLAQRAAGVGARGAYGWVAMMVVVTALSWFYLTRPHVKAD